MRKFLSRYHPRYVRSLVYMLQASEYSIRDYISWLHRVKDFTNVEQRKHLVTTPKAMAMLFLVFATQMVLYGGVFSLLFLSTSPIYIALFVCAFVLSPFILAYGILLPLMLLQFFVQLPVTYFKFLHARKILSHHKSVKIGIAGSFGKTSMRDILLTVLSEGKKTASPSGSYNTPLGISSFVKTLKGDEEVLIFEMGEYYRGDIAKLCNLVQPQIGIITGVNEAHFEKFKDIEETKKTIFELAEYSKERPVYVNGENARARAAAGRHHILYERTGTRAWSVPHAQTGLSGTTFTLLHGDKRLEIKTKLFGLHHIGPLCVAADIGLRLGLSYGQIERGLNKTKPFEHRLEPKTDQNGVVTLDDSYNGNPDGVVAVIDFLTSLSQHRRYYMTPGLVEMGTRTEAVHKEIGRKLADSGIEKVILIKNSVTPYIEQGLRENSFTGEIIWYDDARSAFSALPYLTVKGDVVLIQNDWPDQYA